MGACAGQGRAGQMGSGRHLRKQGQAKGVSPVTQEKPSYDRGKLGNSSWCARGVFSAFYRPVFTHKAEENNLFRNRVTPSPNAAVAFRLGCPPRSLCAIWKEGDSNVNEGM